jgi:DNA modification methylase
MPKYREEIIGDCRLILGDCLEIMPTLGKVDAVVTDPPYGIGGSNGTIGEKRGKGNYTGAFTSEMDTPNYIKTLVVPVIELCINKSKAVAVTTGIKNISLYPQPDSFGSFFQPNGSGLQTFGTVDSQPIFYYGKNNNHNMGISLSWQIRETPTKNIDHPCPKPILAWTRLVKSVTKERQTVLDPFMGSGTTGVACVNLGRKFIGIELEEKYFDIACKRIDQANRQGKLFAPPKPKPEERKLF